MTKQKDNTKHRRIKSITLAGQLATTGTYTTPQCKINMDEHGENDDLHGALAIAVLLL